MNDSLYTLSYVSRSVIEQDDRASHIALLNILKSARRNNNLFDVTGVLLFNKFRFFQIL